MPAELLAYAVAVLPYARAQPPDFCCQRVAIEVNKIFVHVAKYTIVQAGPAALFLLIPAQLAHAILPVWRDGLALRHFTP